MAMRLNARRDPLLVLAVPRLELERRQWRRFAVGDSRVPQRPLHRPACRCAAERGVAPECRHASRSASGGRLPVQCSRHGGLRVDVRCGGAAPVGRRAALGQAVLRALSGSRADGRLCCLPVVSRTTRTHSSSTGARCGCAWRALTAPLPTMRRPTGGRWRMIRYFVIDEADASAQIGFEAQSPTGNGVRCAFRRCAVPPRASRGPPRRLVRPARRRPIRSCARPLGTLIRPGCVARIEAIGVAIR